MRLRVAGYPNIMPRINTSTLRHGKKLFDEKLDTVKKLGLPLQQINCMSNECA
jgi:hypothetical protein